jgi:hydroxyacylglutathione hydrolase
VIFRQVIQEDLGCASYLVGDEGAGVAAVIDPRFDVGVYLELAELFDVRITDLFETHTHADHVSGHGRLAELTGATIHVHEDSGADYAHSPLRDGTEIALGVVVVRAIHMPGHRPEHTAFALIDGSRGDRPWALLSGDSLLVGDVARPDLAVGQDEGAALLYSSISALLGELAPETELWPGHVGGSSCGSAAIDMKTSSTLGFERANNPLLSLAEGDFVKRVNAELGERPPNYEAIVALNRGPLSSTMLKPAAVDAPMAEALIRNGTIPVDVRSAREFDAGHIPGAVSIPVTRPGFATSLARTFGGEPELLLAGGDEAGARRAARSTESIGLSRITAVLAGGMAAWVGAGLETERAEALTPAELAKRLGDPELQVLDVRDGDTWEEGSIPGALNAPYAELSRLPAQIDPHLPVVTICSSGRRAGIAASLLRRAGVESVAYVSGGGVSEVLEGETLKTV